MFYERMKNIDVRYHFIREVIACEYIAINKTNTYDNHDDMMIKALPVSKFKHCLNLVGAHY